MSDRQKIAGRYPKLNRAQAEAIKALVYDGASLTAAAQAAGLSQPRLSQLMKQPHFKQALDAERDVLISAARATNVRAAMQVRDDPGAAGGARVAAMRLIEELSAPQSSAGAVAPPSPGYVIVMPAHLQRQALPWPTAPSGPLIEHEPARDSASPADDD